MTQDRRVAVIGLGYVGLPLAISFVEAGLAVEGIDAYAGRVEELNAGSSPIDDVTNDRLAAALRSGLRVLSPRRGGPRGGRRDLRLRPDADHDHEGPGPRAGPLGGRDDPRRVRAGQLIVLQSTTYPGTTMRPVPRGPRTERPQGRRGLRPRLRARSGSTPATRRAPARASRGWSARRRPEAHDAGRRAPLRTSTTTSSR